MVVKRWIVPVSLVVAVLFGLLLHDVAAHVMIDQGIAGVLLGAGAGGRPAEASFALLFAVLRILGLPLAGAALWGAAVITASNVVSRRSRSR